MKLQKGKWYVCIKNWSDDGWTKFYDGMLVKCYNDDVIILDRCSWKMIILRGYSVRLLK